MQRKNLIVYTAFCILSIVSMMISKAGQHIASGLLLCIGAVLLYGYYFAISRSLVDLRALLSLFWVGGEGIAAFQLSKLQTEWTITTWICFTGFYIMFLIGYELCNLFWKTRKAKKKKVYSRAKLSNCLMICIILIAVGSLTSFITEVIHLGYVPILSEETHAYSNFHVTGLHYFTVTCMMVHALTLIYIMNRKSRMDRADIAMLILCNCMALLVAVACISKFQLLLTVALPAIIYLRMKKDLNYRKIFLWGGIGIIGVAVVFTLMILRRNYGEGYLNDIFEMKNQNLPMAIQYPYMYIANNYANFNCMTEQLVEHSWGIKMLFPVFALTGLKFVFPEMLAFPVYITKTELNTLTIIYDAFYDFGIIGVLIFGIVLGGVCAYVTRKTKKSKNPITYLFYGQIAMYVFLSFFSAWFSVPTTWFWFAVTAFLYLIVEKGARKSIVSF